jgi:CRP/FNR family cyclic AMP-dependent transcriptional regulator
MESRNRRAQRVKTGMNRDGLRPADLSVGNSNLSSVLMGKCSMSSQKSTPRIRFLDALPGSVRVLLDRIASPKHFAAGAVIFQEGLEHDHIYVVLEGSVRLEMFVEGRGRLPLMTAGPGNVIGWSPLFVGHPMTATAIALEPVHTVSFDGQELRTLCEANHELGYHVMRQLALTLSERLLATRLQLLDLFLEHQPARTQPIDSEC